MKRKTWKLLCGVALGWLLLVGRAEASNFLKLRGYMETRYTHIFGVDLGSLCDRPLASDLILFQKQLDTSCDPKILINRIRPSALIRFSRNLRLRVTANFVTTHFRLEPDITSIDQLLTVDRLYLDMRTGIGDIRIGKQSFNWGPSQLWSLTVPFAPQDPTDFNAELPGLWAITLNIPYASNGSLRVAVMAAEIPSNPQDVFKPIAFARWQQTFGVQDVGLVFLFNEFQKRITFGAEVKGTFGVGYWVEAAYHVPYEKPCVPNSWTGKDSCEAQNQMILTFTAGIDYSFKVLESLVVSLQYYYSSAGIADPSKYPFKTKEGLQALAGALFGATNTPNNQVTGVGIGSGAAGFLGAHYLLLTAALSVNEDVNISLTSLANLRDPSFFVGPFLSWNVLADLSITIGAYLYLGPDGSEFSPGKIQFPTEGLTLPTTLKNALEGGLVFSPRAVAFGWVRYNF